ncbi:MAG: hypothetical protein VB095_02965 [Anaerovorax sp.]|nr:hypothetical protein [Anaerovorax sp.]
MSNLEQRVSKAIEIDKRMKEDKKELDIIKAELQAEALQEMENKNLKYVEYFGTDGSCAIAYKEKFEVDNFPALVDSVGEVIEGKYTKEESVKITVDKKLQEALIALYKGEYKQHDITQILKDLYLDDKQIKVALKKLKDDYKKDKELLESLGVKSDIEEELDAIREQKNYELVEKFFDLRQIDIERVKKSISVEDSLSVGLNYEK